VFLSPRDTQRRVPRARRGIGGSLHRRAEPGHQAGGSRAALASCLGGRATALSVVLEVENSWKLSASGGDCPASGCGHPIEMLSVRKDPPRDGAAGLIDAPRGGALGRTSPFLLPFCCHTRTNDPEPRFRFDEWVLQLLHGWSDRGGAKDGRDDEDDDQSRSPAV
jgi:hypothetical protein